MLRHPNHPNKAFEEAFITRNYICPNCGATMIFEDDYESILVCETCGHSMDIDEYGVDPSDIYYPTKEEVLGILEDDDDDDF